MKAIMQEILDKFFKTITSQLKLICEGKYEATDELLKFSDKTKYDNNISELAETIGLTSIKLEAREMALENTIDKLKQTFSERKQFSIFFMFFTFLLFFIFFIIISSDKCKRKSFVTKIVNCYY